MRFCLSHAQAECHGCDDAAASAAKSTFRSKHTKMKGAPVLRGNKRAQVKIALAKKLSTEEESRTNKKNKKKKSKKKKKK